MANEMTLRAKIERYLSKLGSNGTAIVDSSNVGKYLGNYYLWKTASAYVEKKEKEALAEIVSAGLYDEEGTKGQKEGSYEIASSKGFSFTVTVTKPVRRLDKDKLVKILSESKYKIPAGVARLYIEDAYKGDKPQVRKHIAEK